MSIENMPNDSTGDAIRRWKDEGSDLSRPMKIDFFIALPSEEVGKAISQAPELAGFSKSIERDAQSLQWTCYCAKEMIPAYDEITAIEHALEALAGRFNANYDGFGSFGNAR